jgi:signal transduction histidine kinase
VIRRPLALRLVAATSALLAMLVAVCALNTTLWVGTSFPGFFVMANRVVASIELPDWAPGRPSRLFQGEILAVDGREAASSADVYARARSHPPDTPVAYDVGRPDGRVVTLTVPTRIFRAKDHLMLFGAFLLNGVVFLATGLAVFALKPQSPASHGLLAACLIAGVWVVTATDLYGPHWFFRIHVLAESLLAAGFIHLALVFPTDRIRGHRLPAMLAVYAPFGLLAVAYEVWLSNPRAYTLLHRLATASHFVGTLAIIAAVVHARFTSRSALVRRRISVVSLGTLGGLLLPGLLMGASALLGGRVPLNAAAFTPFLFPLSLGYAIAKQDLFEIDVMLRRAASYVIVLIALGAAYFATLWALGHMLPVPELLADSPVGIALLNLLVLFAIVPLKTRVEDGVDRMFSQQRYDAQGALARLGYTLVSAHTPPDVAAETGRVLADTLGPVRCSLLPTDDGVRHHTLDRRRDVVLPRKLLERLQAGRIVARYEWDDGSGRPLPAVWDTLGAELLVPVREGSTMIALLVLGPKASGRAYAPGDTGFLVAVANQVALGLTNAHAFTQLAALNASLEAQVSERTAALEAAHREVSRSLGNLRGAYEQLERNQTSLMRSDRLATLGRLAAGIAHEVNTPLGAVMNELHMIADLAREYSASIDDPGVTPRDHHEIAGELLTTTEAAESWARKAAAFIAKVKIHGREPSVVRERFAVSRIVDETRALLAHRLRATGCRLDYEETPADVAVVGEPARLGQVVVNLVGNAIDAYEDAAVANRIVVRATRDAAGIGVTVRDWAGGIPADVVPRIFDELFTTKEPGRGTGLGLWIARNLTEEVFGGSLTVETELGVGSCFTIRIAPEHVATDGPELRAAS